MPLLKVSEMVSSAAIPALGSRQSRAVNQCVPGGSDCFRHTRHLGREPVVFALRESEATDGKMMES
jgi:hypothetical protein